MTVERSDEMGATYHGVMDFLDRHIIQEMAESNCPFGATETCWAISNFTNEWITRDMARAILRSLTDRGYCYYSRGLFNENGEVAGAGYGLTRKGLARYEDLCPQAAYQRAERL